MTNSSLDLGGGSSLNLGGNSSKAAASTLDLNGGSNGDGKGRLTRGSARNRKPEVMEEEEEQVSDDKPQCLEGLTIVVSGIFNLISRDKIEFMIAEYGGRCTGSVSGKTDYLITGHKLEDGREVTQGGKYRNA